jgi:hypothetical protein
MPTSRGNLSPAGILRPGLNTVFNEVGSAHKTEYTEIFKVEGSTKNYEEDAQIVMLGPTPTKPEGADTTFDDPIPNANQKRYTHLAYGIATRITHEATEDELYGQIKKVPAATARSDNYTIEQVAANVYNLGFTTATDINGVTIYNSTHASLGTSGTYDNSVTTAFGFTALQAMTNYFEGMTDNRGMVIATRPSLLVLPFNLRFTAREIFGTQKKPFTGDNEINSLLDEDLRWTVNHYLTSTTAWHTLGSNREVWPKFYWREKPSYRAWDHELSGDVMTRSYMRFSVGVTLALNMYGSTGV